MQPVYVVTCEQWYAAHWSLEAVFESEREARDYVHGSTVKLDLCIYRCSGGIDFEQLTDVSKTGIIFGHCDS